MMFPCHSKVSSIVCGFWKFICVLHILVWVATGPCEDRPVHHWLAQHRGRMVEAGGALRAWRRRAVQGEPNKQGGGSTQCMNAPVCWLLPGAAGPKQGHGYDTCRFAFVFTHSLGLRHCVWCFWQCMHGFIVGCLNGNRSLSLFLTSTLWPCEIHVFTLQDELYLNGAVVLPHKEIKESALQPTIIL